MGLEGTIKTPMGSVPKKTAVYVGTGVVLIAAIIYYRRQQGASATATTNTTDTTTDPATGYGYGTAEDLAALQAQGNYTTAVTSTTGGSSSYPNQGTGYVSNGAWSQAVIQTMSSNGSVQDVGPLSQALGKYLNAQYVVPGSTDDLLITQAIAQEGFPPVNGSNGMPPAINRTPPSGTSGTSTPSDPTLPAPTGLKVVRADRNGLSLNWNPVSGAIGYQVYVNGKQSGSTVTYSSDYAGNLKPNTTYTINVYPVNNKSRNGHWATIKASTKK